MSEPIQFEVRHDAHGLRTVHMVGDPPAEFAMNLMLLEDAAPRYLNWALTVTFRDDDGHVATYQAHTGDAQRPYIVNLRRQDTPDDV